MAQEDHAGNQPRHGARLSLREYERRIVSLHDGLPPSPDKELQAVIQRRELDLAIDHRLGVDFPAERREALWKIQQRAEKRRIGLFFYWILNAISRTPLRKGANRMAGHLVDEFARVLSREELRAFFQLEEGERPALPDDRP